MKKILTILIIAAILIVGIWLVLIKPAQTPPVGTPIVTPTATSNQPAATPTPRVSSNTAVTIQNFAFLPATVTINRGTTVTWTNQDSAPHQIVSDAGSIISSQVLSSGDTFSLVFDQVGTYAYHCAIHPSMKGTIVVK